MGVAAKLLTMCIMNTVTKEQIKNELANYVAKIGSQNAASKRLTNVSNATISNILAEKWDNIGESMWISIQKQITVSLEGWQVVSNVRRVKQLHQLYSDAKDFSEVFCVVAPAGSGKSQPATLFTEYPNVYRVVCKEHFSRKTFLVELLTAMGKDGSGYTIHELMNEVLNSILKAEKPLIILDEVDKLNDQVLYFFISIYNTTEDKCGIVLQATDFFKKRITRGVSANRKGYKEIYSRFGRNFVELPNNTDRDLAEIIKANGVKEEGEIIRITNQSEGDIRRIKRLVKAYLRKEAA